MKLTWLLFIWMIVDCYSVSVDYYFGKQEPEFGNKKYNNTKEPKAFKNVLQTARRINANNSSETTTEKNDELNYESYDELSEIEDQVMKRTSKIKAPIGQNDFDTDSRQAEIGYDTNADLRQGVDYILKLKSFEDIIKDYAYHDDAAGTANPMLRDHTKTTATQTEFDFNKIVILKNTTTEENESENLSFDFYNVMPASSADIDNDDYSRPYYHLNHDIWYVPENSPCWDLPILYGESGRTFKTSVFFMYPADLKNVIETKEEQSKPSRPLYIPASQTMNKWCAAGPCYGDHTMCLFSDNIYSKLCINGYTVSTPTMVEQIGLVNTVNSMRNRIANGETDKYKHLPKAADMNQLIYDFDLESMAAAWLHQCLPGPAACSALDGNYVSQLECTKSAKHCCINSFKNERASKCIPQYECYIDPIIGCIHVWFWKAGKALTTTDVECGHITPTTFYTAQLIWAETTKLGCAYGTKPNGDVRVVCNFAPGAPFYIDTKFYCGFIGHAHPGVLSKFKENITSVNFLKKHGILLTPMNRFNTTEIESTNNRVNLSLRFSDRDILGKIFKRKWIRENSKGSINGTVAFVARLVTKYTFGEDSGSQCDMNEAIYESGEPGSKCVERGRRFHALCYDFRDPTPGYRLVAVVAPVALFSLILYDLFSGVVRQTNY